MDKIQIEGFRKEFNNFGLYGKGTYFARDSKYSVDYSTLTNNGIRKMFLCVFTVSNKYHIDPIRCDPIKINI